MRITVKDIAAELGISQGTVSKALIGKKGISEKTRNNVLETAERLGYRVNRVAQTLSRQPIHIGVVASKKWIEYYGEITSGIERETAKLADYNVESLFYWVSSPTAVDEIEQAISMLKEQKVDAAIFCLATAMAFAESLNDLVNSGVPTMIVGTRLHDLQFPVVRLDSNIAGHMAAEFLNGILPPDQDTAIFIGNKDIYDHNDKVKGYIEEMNNVGRRVVGVYETQDDPELGYWLTRKILSDYPRIGGIYVATGNSIAVCEGVTSLQRGQNFKIIGTDIFPELVSAMKQGVIQAVIYQNPILQGEIAVRMIYRQISEKKEIEKEILIPPQLVLRSNVESVQNYSQFQ